MPSPGSSMVITLPWFITMTRSQFWRITSVAWLTTTMVRPSRWNFLTWSRHLRWNDGVADGQHLVDQQHVGLHVDGHREPEPDVHARRVELDLVVDEVLELGEGDDVVVALLDVGMGEARAATR